MAYYGRWSQRILKRENFALMALTTSQTDTVADTAVQFDSESVLPVADTLSLEVDIVTDFRIEGL